MANAQIMQEELQQSVVLSEEDADFEEDDTNDAMAVDSGAPANLANTSEQHLHGPTDDARADEDSELDDVAAEEDVGPQQGQQNDLDELPVNEDDADEDGDESGSEAGQTHDEDDAFEDEDAEVEDDHGIIGASKNDRNAIASSVEDEEEDEDEDEGVGAVKIKPGETDESESESEDNISLASGASSDQESVAEWEEVHENEDDDDEESEAATNNCIFCKKPEEDDPAEEFEPYLACKSCGEHAHQQCAREADALHEGDAASSWKCPECGGNDEDYESEADPEQDKMDTGPEVNGDDREDGDISPTSTRRSSVPKIARDLLPAQRGTDKADSHSVFNQLVLVEDPMDGSRVLRKRKTSSIEADDADVMSLRKRRKNTSDGSVQNDTTPSEKVNGGAEDSVRPRSARSLRLKIPSAGTQCTVVKKTRSSLVVRMRVDATELQRILSQMPRSTRKRSGRTIASRSSRAGASSSAARGTTATEPLTVAPVFPSSYSQPFYSFYDKETDELKGKPYGGILTEEQADTTKTLPTKDDRRRFDEAKQKAEEEWRNRLLAVQAETEPPARKSKKSAGPASQIECIEFGGWEIDTWYAAPYPEEYSRNRVLYICEFCLKYMNSDYVAWRHKLKCPAKHPPGDEIYRHGSISFFEVDGRKNPVYCQNLCLLAKLFLGSKTLYYDVEPFLFYVLCEYDDLGYHFVGYFSKEKRASSQNNVSCILTLPIHQRKGYGNLLIDFSYLLTRAEAKTGSPEKPLSDMGLVSYRNYWRLVMSKYLISALPEHKSQKKGLSIRQISDDTGMVPDDVISALEGLRCLVRDPVTGAYAFRVDLTYCRQYVEKWESKNYVSLNPDALTWTPYVMGRSNATNFELGPALNTMAPREEDDDTKAAAHVLAESGIATGDFAITSQASQKSALGPESAVLESTEPNDDASIEPVEGTTKLNGVRKENGEAQDETQAGPATESTTDAIADEKDWLKAYKDIPATRFQVFPPVNPRRPGPARMNSGVRRPSLPRAPPSATRARPKPKARRPTSGAVRKAAPKKTSTAKRKTGGTGRGPGRWPKGTKKSDYGNADSGPGLPPAWIERKRQEAIAAAAAAATAKKENETMDTVNVQVHETKAKETKAKKGKQSDTISARFQYKPEDSLEVKAGGSSTMGAGNGATVGDADLVMGEAGEEAAGDDE
ncbi:hypothetical protein DL767_004435 [Monosporascus sp. MG133]|nr:hypothetical protein DL767_004435 [Monosporascus sp. MG133]